MTIAFPNPNILTPEQEAELRRQCEVLHARSLAYAWRNLFCIVAVSWFVWATWPWMVGFAEIARYWSAK